MKLEEIEKLCAEATPEPWQVFLPCGDDRANLSGPKQYTEFRFSLEDAVFIAASRDLMPKLLLLARAVELFIEDPDTYGELEETFNKLVGEKEKARPDDEEGS